MKNINKEKLTYLAAWGKHKETAWSGTYYSLLTALRKRFLIENIDVTSSWWQTKIYRRILKKDEATILELNLKKFRKRLQDLEGSVFQFTDYLNNTDKRKTFMYVDNLMSYVKYLRDSEPEIAKIAEFTDIPSSLVDLRAKEQDDYVQSSTLFTMGHWLKEWLVKHGLPESHIHAVGGGCNVNTSLIKKEVKTNNKILFVGKAFKRKGGYITYEAFKLLRDQGKNVELYVIGPSENPIKESIEGYHYIGQIPFCEEAKYFNMCDIFCMPSYFEAYGLVFVEALSFGLPCIGRNCYEMPYFIDEGKTGLLLKNDDPRELSELMLQILENVSFANNVLSRQEQYIKNYSWDAVANRICEIIL